MPSLTASISTTRAPAPLTAWQRHVVWACWLFGGLARLVFILIVHPATAYVYSDMQGYRDRAISFAMQAPGGIADTLYPPGASMLFGVLYRLDPSWTLVMITQWLISLAVMALIWLIARRVQGTASAVVALVMATLYFPFVHYASLFLSENAFMLFLLASVWLLLIAVQGSTRRVTLIAALLAGIAAGLAVAFKNTMLGAFAVTGLVYALYALRHRERHFIPVALAVVVGLSLVMTPLAQRCTRLDEGHYCLSANNLAMNVLLGHHGPVREIRWVDPKRQIAFYFTAVESTLRGYRGSLTLDFGPYDSARNAALARQWIADHPIAALRSSLLNVWSLFARPTLWPSAVIRGADYGVWSQRAFWLVILLPALFMLVRRAPVILRLRRESLDQWLLIAPVLGLTVSVFISISEVRFRVPFDGLLMVLAAPVWVALLQRLRLMRGGQVAPARAALAADE